ncbi:TetR/AcrR family transcriptional regulator [Rhodococcus erythropolis]|uniref:TetR/AcrR family transcriptional regulator n=1 Tax=Rhodococcus erythropolis TaxID=1833 RepID=UPI00222640BE|nr:TetR/AcrR family transcriptional regulator [Rhodococcus erythropolis]MCW2295473.1 AcrR family transcriptional regulator [Rhodococcus erythropolis]
MQGEPDQPLTAEADVRTRTQSDSGTPAPLEKVRRRRPGAGRRRDPRIDEQILVAARRVYMEAGWEGFKFDTIAKAASVSRDALYRRYESLEDLLWAVLLSGANLSLQMDTSDARTVLHDFGMELYDYFTKGGGALALRVHLEAWRFPELYRNYRDRLLDPQMKDYQKTITALLEREGVDVATVNVQALVEAINGAVMFHALLNQATPHDIGRTAASREFVKIQIDQALVVTGLVAVPERR